MLSIILQSKRISIAIVIAIRPKLGFTKTKKYFDKTGICLITKIKSSKSKTQSVRDYFSSKNWKSAIR